MRGTPRGVHGLDDLSLRMANLRARLDHGLHRHDPRQPAGRKALQDALDALGAAEAAVAEGEEALRVLPD